MATTDLLTPPQHDTRFSTPWPWQNAIPSSETDNLLPKDRLLPRGDAHCLECSCRLANCVAKRSQIVKCYSLRPDDKRVELAMHDCLTSRSSPRRLCCRYVGRSSMFAGLRPSGLTRATYSCIFDSLCCMHMKFYSEHWLSLINVTPHAYPHVQKILPLTPTFVFWRARMQFPYCSAVQRRTCGNYGRDNKRNLDTNIVLLTY